MLPVRLVAEPDDVIAHLTRVVLQPARPAATSSSVSIASRIRRRRDLRVHDDVLAARQPDDQVRRQADAVGRDRFLEVEVAVLEHAGRFDDAAQLQLAPLPADVGRAKRLHEPAGFHLQRSAGA